MSPSHRSLGAGSHGPPGAGEGVEAAAPGSLRLVPRPLLIPFPAQFPLLSLPVGPGLLCGRQAGLRHHLSQE